MRFIAVCRDRGSNRAEHETDQDEQGQRLAPALPADSDARKEQRRMATDAQAASGTPTEGRTAVRLSAANAEVSAREAWVGWIERGV